MKLPALIVEVKPEWQEDFDNLPTFRALLTRVTPLSEFVFEERDNLYGAAGEVEAAFYFYQKPGDGFAGRVYSLKMKDGSVKELKGPWSSNEWAFNGLFPEFFSVNCSVTDSMETWTKGYTFQSSSILLTELCKFWASRETDWGLVLLADGSVCPTKGKFVKGGYAQKNQVTWAFPCELKYRQKRIEFFLKGVEEWKKQNNTPRNPQFSAEQLNAVGL